MAIGRNKNQNIDKKTTAHPVTPFNLNSYFPNTVPTSSILGTVENPKKIEVDPRITQRATTTSGAVIPTSTKTTAKTVPAKTSGSGSGSGGSGGGSYSAPATTTASTQNDALTYMTDMFNKLMEAQYNSPYAQAQQAALDKLLNREAFSYNHLEDPAYQAYAKQYAFYGDQARQDTLGDVAGMTGGMPSSYAVSAAQQAQNQWNSRLTDIIPQLQDAAYQRYQGDFQNNVDVSNILATLDSTAYSRYDNDRNFAWNGASTIGGMQYQVNRDNVLDAQWLAQFNADEAQRAVSNAINQKQISIQEGELALKKAEAERSGNGHYTEALAEAFASGDPVGWLQKNAANMTPEMYEWLKSQIGSTSSSGI